ncbi:MAG: DUF3568 family protein [Candidatus Omnitrophota bacterium]
MGRKIGLLVAGFLFLASLSGCIALLAAGAGVGGTAAWLSGKLTQEVGATYDQTLSATRRGLKSMKMEIERETRSDDVTQFRSKYSDGRETWVDVRPVTPSSTQIEIRVGAIGDKEPADRILKNILRYL